MSGAGLPKAWLSTIWTIEQPYNLRRGELSPVSIRPRWKIRRLATKIDSEGLNEFNIHPLRD
jgi:hypothetical protein